MTWEQYAPEDMFWPYMVVLVLLFFAAGVGLYLALRD
jgi:hypothetical protein